MLKLNGRSLLLGGFHDHWSRWDAQNPALLLAALNYYHYDFVTLMCGPDIDGPHRVGAELLSRNIKIYPGREEFFGWGHVVVVNPRKPRITGDDPDYERTLQRLKASSNLVILAHPNYPGTWEKLFLTGEMDRLMDNGTLDGINLINTTGFEESTHRQLINWFNKRDASGLKTPIVGGWDAHLLLPQNNLPVVLYGNRSPRGHIDTCGHNRTILFCEENSLEAILQAVREGQTLIEDLKTGELVGPAPLVQWLRENDYAGAIAELDAWRNQQKLSIASPWSAGSDNKFKTDSTFEVSVAVPTEEGLKLASVIESGEDSRVIWPFSPSGRDVDYACIVQRNGQGQERIWAVETRHPIQLQILPRFKDGQPGIEISAAVPFEGTLSIDIPEIFNWRGMVQGNHWLKLPESVVDKVFPIQWNAENVNGITRHESSHLSFLTARHFAGDWDKVTVFSVDDVRFVPNYSYGVERPYPGKEVIAAYYQFAWDESAFYWRAYVRDAVHYQPNENGHYLYNADCLQLAIDPLSRRQASVGHVYSFNLALTPRGPLLHRWLTPNSESTPGFVAPPADTSLPADYLTIEPTDDGLIYQMSLPWSELAPAIPQSGHPLGIYTILFNNDGDGLLDSMHWPLPLDGMWQIPKAWASLHLL